MVTQDSWLRRGIFLSGACSQVSATMPSRWQQTPHHRDAAAPLPWNGQDHRGGPEQKFTSIWQPDHNDIQRYVNSPVQEEKSFCATEKETQRKEHHFQTTASKHFLNGSGGGTTHLYNTTGCWKLSEEILPRCAASRLIYNACVTWTCLARGLLCLLQRVITVLFCFFVFFFFLD